VPFWCSKNYVDQTVSNNAPIITTGCGNRHGRLSLLCAHFQAVATDFWRFYKKISGSYIKKFRNAQLTVIQVDM
jgi:hypothetical protein